MSYVENAIHLMRQAQNAIRQGDRGRADQLAQQAYSNAQQSGRADVAAAVVNHANSWGPVQPSGGPGPGTQPAPTPQPAAPTVVGIQTVYEAGGFNVTYQIMSDGSRQETSRVRERTAGDAVEDMFRNLGLGDEFASSLKGIIDNLYQSNVKPTKSEIMNAVYTSEPYKQRFKANEIIRKRMEDGEGRPGDRMLTPAEYIEAENTYRTILADRDMPMGFYDSYDDFTNLIANSISANEFKSRVDTAYDALNFADDNVISALRDYYGLNQNELVAYLLDPARALPVLENTSRMRMESGAYDMNSRTELQRMYGTATVAGMGRRQGLAPGQDLSGEIYDLGKTKQETEAAFSKAAEQGPDVERLGKLYGESMDFKDLVREDLNLSGGAAAGRKKRKFASKERAKFGQRSALGSTSLRDRTDV